MGLYYGRLSVLGKEVISGPKERNPEPRREGPTQRVERICCALFYEVLGDSSHLSIEGCSTLSSLAPGSSSSQLKGGENSELF